MGKTKVRYESYFYYSRKSGTDPNTTIVKGIAPIPAFTNDIKTIDLNSTDEIDIEAAMRRAASGKSFYIYILPAEGIKIAELGNFFQFNYKNYDIQFNVEVYSGNKKIKAFILECDQAELKLSPQPTSIKGVPLVSLSFILPNAEVRATSAK